MIYTTGQVVEITEVCDGLDVRGYTGVIVSEVVGGYDIPEVAIRFDDTLALEINTYPKYWTEGRQNKLHDCNGLLTSPTGWNFSTAMIKPLVDYKLEHAKKQALELEVYARYLDTLEI